MKQKGIIITDKLSLDAEQLIYEYFAVKRIGKIEGFIVSEEEFINRHQGTYAYQEMMQADYHAVYKVQSCDICFKSFKVNIISREHLNKYFRAKYKLCRGCQKFHFHLSHTMGMKLDGDVAS